MSAGDNHDAFERALLASAQHDAPEEGALARELARLGVAASVATGAAAAAGLKDALGVGATTKGAGAATGVAKGAAVTVGVKSALAMLVGGSLAVGVALTTPLGSERPAAGVSEGPRRSAPSSAAPGSSPAGRASAAEERASDAVPAATVAAATTKGTPAVVRAAKQPSPIEAPAAASLSEEVALVDRARALVHGSPRESLVALDDHARRFPRGALRDEAAVMRVEALQRLGDLEGARRVAGPFLEGRSRSPLATRMRALLEPP